MAPLLRTLAAAALVLTFVPSVGAQEPSCRLIRGANTPTDPTDDVEVCRQDAWFHANARKLGNTSFTGHEGFPTFNTTRPTASVIAGGGGGYLGSSVTHQNGTPFDPALTATFDGAFTGDIDNLAVTMFLFNPAEDAQELPTFAVNTRLVVDNEPILEISGAEVKRSASGQVHRLDFALVDLYAALKDAGLHGKGKEHQVRFQVQGTGLATESAMFVYDAQEVPGGLIFNIEPENLASYTVVG
ncbi:MAG: hypothetical protein ACRDH9_03725 [Actinomycetota bacterium]